MTYTDTITVSWGSGSEAALTGPLSKTGDGADRRQLTIPDSTDGQEVDISWTNANLLSLYLLASRAMTVFSNVDGGAGNDTVALAAGVPKIYQSSSGMTNPFATADVTKLYVDNASGGSGTLDIRVLLDSTP